MGRKGNQFSHLHIWQKSMTYPHFIWKKRCTDSVNTEIWGPAQFFKGPNLILHHKFHTLNKGVRATHIFTEIHAKEDSQFILTY